MGERLAGRFELEAYAASGASALVFRARDLHSGERVAVKYWWGTRPVQAERSTVEAEALAAVSHPGVVGYVAHGTTPAGIPFLAMPWIEGETLSERLRGPGLTPSECLVLAERISSGLAALHAQGFVHRDLKPSNILLPGGRVEDACIVDLGVARAERSQLDLTADGAYVGTPRYMAPEQIRAPQKASGASDVFSLGCILYEALTGVPAYDAAEMFAVLAQILFEPAPHPRRRRRELPLALDQLVASMLSRRPANRPQAGEALNEKLRALRVSVERLGPPPQREPAAVSGDPTACSGVRSR
ncbi:MAG TPA: serine/threonine-protein kinase [Polyangiales bacterium]|nr:serine/threonine-protein kinase [Polyangiales bacterium]